MAGVGFGVLGPLEMSVDGALVPVRTPKQRAVLAMLVINRNRPVGTDSLINAVWEESAPPGARASLHSYVSNLRKLLDSVGVDSGRVLVSAPPGYRLSVPDADCDLGRFIIEKNVSVQAAAAGNFEQASRHMSAALAEWRGPVLEDLRDFEFVNAYATALVEDKVTAHSARAEAEIACGRASAVIGELESLTAEHPYREPLWAQLITAYYLAERQSDALDAHRRLKNTLADDLGIDPGPDHPCAARADPAPGSVRRQTSRQENRRRHRHQHRPPHRGQRAVYGAPVARRFRAVLPADEDGHPDRAPVRQRHRPRRPGCQSQPRRHHRHRHQLRHRGYAVGERSSCAAGANSEQRDAGRRRQRPHLGSRVHVRIRAPRLADPQLGFRCGRHAEALAWGLAQRCPTQPIRRAA